jgi:hypothetical protein
MAPQRVRTRLVGDVLDILDHVISHHEPAPVSVDLEQEEDAAWRIQYYHRFSDLDRGEQYYRTVTVCKLLYRDILSGCDNPLLRKYAPGIERIAPSSVSRIRYDNEAEEYVIRSAEGEEIRIYKGDVAYIYPLYCQVPDAAEYDIAYEGEEVFSYAIYNDATYIPVF